MKKNKQVIIFDVDGVLLNWLSQIIAFLEFKKVDIPEEIYKAISEDKFLDFVLLNKIVPEFLKEYHCSEFAQNLLPMDPRLPQLLKYYKNKHNYKFIGLTSFSKHSKAKKNRKINLDKYYGDKFFDKLIILPEYASKKEALQELKKKHNVILFVDDLRQNVIDGIEVFGVNKVWHLDQKNSETNWTKLFVKLNKL